MWSFHSVPVCHRFPWLWESFRPKEVTSLNDSQNYSNALCYRHLTLLIFLEIKEIYPLKYESNVRRQFCFFEAYHINLFFCLILGNKICLQSSSSSSRSFNISTNDKFNQKSTLRLQFIKTSPHFPSFYIFHCRVSGEKTSWSD